MSFVRAGVVRPIRPLIVMVAVSMALVVAAQSALGATEVNPTGKRGTWTLTDTSSQPGGFCTYNVDADPKLDRLQARSPRVKARNRTSGRDGQWVGIKIIFEKAPNGGSDPWQTVDETDWIKKHAFDNQAVGIGKRSWQAPNFPGDPLFRVRAKVRWYKPGSKSIVKGAVILNYENYDKTPGTETVPDYCLPNL